MLLIFIMLFLFLLYTLEWLFNHDWSESQLTKKKKKKKKKKNSIGHRGTASTEMKMGMIW